MKKGIAFLSRLPKKYLVLIGIAFCAGLLICSKLFFSPPHSSLTLSSSPSVSPTPSSTSVDENTNKGPELETLIASADPEPTYEPITALEILENTGLSFPASLLNQVAESIQSDQNYDWMAQWNDPSLQISMDEFTIGRRTGYPDGSEIDFREAFFYEELDKEHSYTAYRFDGDQDGLDEIYLLTRFTDSMYAVDNLLQLFILEAGPKGEYFYSAWTAYEDAEIAAAFQYEGEYFFFILKNKPEYMYEDSSNTDSMDHLLSRLEIARVKKRTNEYTTRNWPVINVLESVKLNRSSTESFSLLYPETDTGLVGAMKTYVKKQNYVSRWRVAPGDHQVTGAESLIRENLYRADVNNDGTPEVFERIFTESYVEGDSQRSQTLTLNWFEDTESMEFLDEGELKETTSPFLLPVPSGYILSQLWFEEFHQQTVTFSLFKKEVDSTLEENYILDMCIYEDDSRRRIAVYSIQDTDKITAELGSDSLLLTLDYPAFIQKNSYSSTAYPAQLTAAILAFTLPYQASAGQSDLQQGIEALDFEEFKAETQDYFDMPPWEGYVIVEPYFIHNTFRADMDQDGNMEYVTYSWLGLDSASLEIYKLYDGRLKCIAEYPYLDQAYESTLIQYNGSFYFLMQTTDFITKESDEIYALRIFPEANHTVLTIKPQMQACQIIPVKQSDTAETVLIRDYLEQVASELGSYSYEEQMVGDEQKVSMEDVRQLDLDSDDYYKIDSNNDGSPEFFGRYFDFPTSFSYPSQLIIKPAMQNETGDSDDPDSHTQIPFAWSYEESPSHPLEPFPYSDEGTLYQHWYKEFNGKIYTFQLYRTDISSDYHASELVRVYLSENNGVRHIASYLLDPQYSLVFSEEPPREKRIY